MSITAEAIAGYIQSIIATETDKPIASIDTTGSFHSLGLDSITAVYLMELVEKKFDVTLTPLYFWDYPTIEKFSAHIYKENFQS